MRDWVQGFSLESLHWGYRGITEDKMETTMLYRGYIGIIRHK